MPMRSTSTAGSGPCRLIAAASESPSMNSITMYVSCRVRVTSKTRTTFGWLTSAAKRASSHSWSAVRGSRSITSGRRSFSATGIRSSRWVAR